MKAREQLMSASFEIKGIWYFPWQNMDRDGIQGILKYTSQRITLELIGTLEEETGEKYASKRNSYKQVIYGFSNHGEWLALYGCFIIRTQTGIPGFSTVTYLVDQFYAGSQLIENEDAVIVEDITFLFTYLDAWMNIHIIESREYRDSGRIEWSVDLEKALSQKKSIKLNPDNISIVEEIGYTIDHSNDFFSEETTNISIKRFYRLSLIDKSCFSYKHQRDNLQKIKRLLTMLIGSPLYFLYIDFNLPNKQETTHDGKEYKIKNSCRLFFRQVGEINTPQKISPYSDSVLFFRKHIQDNIEVIFNKWFSQQNLLSEIVNPYINDLYLPAYQYTRFLNTVRSLETFHRFFIEDKETPSVSDSSKEKELIISFINENVSEENRAAFIEKINYEDEKSLHKRLKEIFRLTPDALMNKLFGHPNTKDKNKILQIIVQTRNYFTHRDNMKKYPLALGINDLMILEQYIKRLCILLQFHVFKCIDMNPNIIEERLIHYSNHYEPFYLTKK